MSFLSVKSDGRGREGGAECGKRLLGALKFLSFYGSGQDLSPLGESDGGLIRSVILFGELCCAP